MPTQVENRFRIDSISYFFLIKEIAKKREFFLKRVCFSGLSNFEASIIQKNKYFLIPNILLLQLIDMCLNKLCSLITF
jgi:hypothetical protein